MRFEMPHNPLRGLTASLLSPLARIAIAFESMAACLVDVAAAQRSIASRDYAEAAMCWGKGCATYHESASGPGYWTCQIIPPGGECPGCKMPHPLKGKGGRFAP